MGWSVVMTFPDHHSLVFYMHIQYSPYIMPCLGSIGIDNAISEICYKGTITQRNFREMTILWSFSNNSFVNFNRDIIGAIT